MASAIQAGLRALRFAPHAALLLLLAAIAAHVAGLLVFADFLGDCAFFALVLAVIAGRTREDGK